MYSLSNDAKGSLTATESYYSALYGKVASVWSVPMLGSSDGKTWKRELMSSRLSQI